MTRSRFKEMLVGLDIMPRFLAGAAAGATATALTYPLDLLRARQAAHWAVTPRYKNVTAGLREIVRTEGPRALLGGLVRPPPPPTLLVLLVLLVLLLLPAAPGPSPLCAAPCALMAPLSWHRSHGTAAVRCAHWCSPDTASLSVAAVPPPPPRARR